MPDRVQLSRAKGWRMPPNTVKVDRTTRFGNPFVIERQAGEVFRAGEWVGKLHSVRLLGGPYFFRGYLTRAEAVDLACQMFAKEVARGLELERLRGKNLACWCPLDQPCHADVLLELANK